MKIERIENNKLVEIGNLKIGDVFEYQSDVFIKSEYIKDREDDDFNCLDLSDGYLVFLDESTLVKHYPNVKLVLED